MYNIVEQNNLTFMNKPEAKKSSSLGAAGEFKNIMGNLVENKVVGAARDSGAAQLNYARKNREISRRSVGDKTEQEAFSLIKKIQDACKFFAG